MGGRTTLPIHPRFNKPRNQTREQPRAEKHNPKAMLFCSTPYIHTPGAVPPAPAAAFRRVISAPPTPPMPRQLTPRSVKTVGVKTAATPLDAGCSSSATTSLSSRPHRTSSAHATKSSVRTTPAILLSPEPARRARERNRRGFGTGNHPAADSEEEQRVGTDRHHPQPLRRRTRHAPPPANIRNAPGVGMICARPVIPSLYVSRTAS